MKSGVRYSKLKYKCRIKKIKIDISLETFSLFLAMTCFYCNSVSTGLDRVDNNKGYTNANIVPCCGECNRLKSDKYTCEETISIVQCIKALIKARK